MSAGAVLACGQVGQHAVRFPSALREQTDTRPVAAVTLTIPVAVEDLEAIVWWLLDSGVTLQELTEDPAVTGFYVCEALAHESHHTFTAARAAISQLRPRTAAYRRYQWVRELVADLIAPTPAPLPAGPVPPVSSRRVPDAGLVMA